MPSRPSDETSPAEQRTSLKSRKIQGAVLISLGSTMFGTSFALTFITISKDVEFSRWFVVFMLALFIMSLFVISLGVTRWSSKIVSNVSDDAIKIISALLPWKKKE